MQSSLELTSNGFSLAHSQERIGRLQPTSPSLPMAALREQYEAQGYLWLKGILGRDEVIDFRRRYFTAFQDTGLLAPGTDPVDGIYSGLPMPNFNRQLAEIVRWAAWSIWKARRRGASSAKPLSPCKTRICRRRSASALTTRI